MLTRDIPFRVVKSGCVFVNPKCDLCPKCAVWNVAFNWAYYWESRLYHIVLQHRASRSSLWAPSVMLGEKLWREGTLGLRHMAVMASQITTTWLFGQKLAQSNNKENFKALCYWSLVRESPSYWWIPITKNSNEENVSMPWGLFDVLCGWLRAGSIWRTSGRVSNWIFDCVVGWSFGRSTFASLMNWYKWAMNVSNGIVDKGIRLHCKESMVVKMPHEEKGVKTCHGSTKSQSTFLVVGKLPWWQR